MDHQQTQDDSLNGQTTQHHKNQQKLHQQKLELDLMPHSRSRASTSTINPSTPTMSPTAVNPSTPSQSRQSNNTPSHHSTSTTATHIFPHRQIYSPQDLPQLYWSEWFTSVMEYILKVNIALRGKTLQDIDLTSIPPAYTHLTNLLNDLYDLVDRFPPYHQNQRFGNIAYRDWYDAAQGVIDTSLQNIVTNVMKVDDDNHNEEIVQILAVQKEKSLQQQSGREIGSVFGSNSIFPSTSNILSSKLPHNSNIDQDPLQTGLFAPTPAPTINNSLSSHIPQHKQSAPPPFLHHSVNTDHIMDTAVPLSITSPHVAQRVNPLTQHTASQPSPKVTSIVTPTLSSSSLSSSSSISSITSFSLSTTNTPHTQQTPKNYPTLQKDKDFIPQNPPLSSSIATSISSTGSVQQPSTPTRYNALNHSEHDKSNIHTILPCSFSQELMGYLLECFGNYVRIDYGTGHELAFMTFLTACYKSHVLPLSTTNEVLYVGIMLFSAYLRLVRRLQSLFWLEPAGSKGAWGLDDYQFLCFLWGSSQLCAPIGQSQPTFSTTYGNTIADIFNSRDLQLKLNFNENYDDSSKNTSKSRGLLFLDALEFVQLTKTGHLQHTSPVLYSLSQISTWESINDGLLRMYGGEVISKFPVMQHVKFGTILKCDGKQLDQRFDTHEKMVQYKELCTKLHTMLRIPPTVTSMTNQFHAHNMNADAALIIARK